MKIDQAEHPTCKFTLWPLLLSFLLLASGAFHVFLYNKFTPVYTSTECGDEVAEMDQLDIEKSSVHVGLTIQVSCINPNPYSIHIVASTPGRVFVGPQKNVQVGTMAVIPGSALAEHGNGTIRVRMNAFINGSAAHLLLPHFLTDAAVPVLMELQFDVSVHVNFGLGSWGAALPYRKACGLNVAGMLVGGVGNSRMGPLICRDSFAEIGKLPSIGEVSTQYGQMGMGFSAAQVAPAEIKKGTKAKDVSLMTMILLSFSLAVIFIFCAFCNGPSRFLLWVAARRHDLGQISSSFMSKGEAIMAASERLMVQRQNQVKRDEETPLVSPPQTAGRGANEDFFPMEPVREVKSDVLPLRGSLARNSKRDQAASPSPQPARGRSDSNPLPISPRKSMSGKDGEDLPTGDDDATGRPVRTTSSVSASAVSSSGAEKTAASSPTQQELQAQARSSPASSPVVESGRVPSCSSTALIKLGDIKLSGATGPAADVVNGSYRLSAELIGGRAAFQKEDGQEGLPTDLWLCFDATHGNWKVQAGKDKGNVDGYAHSCGPTCDAEFPSMAQEWKVWNLSRFEDQPAVHSAIMPPDPAPLMVRGATGPCADVVNGLYLPRVSDVPGGKPIYKHDAEADIWLCFDLENKNWKVQQTSDKGTSTGFMHSDGPAAGEAFPEMATQWSVWDSETFVSQSSVVVELFRDGGEPARP